MKKRLLMIGLLATSLSMMAQEIFNFGFETPSSELTVGKLDFVNFMARDTMDDSSTLNFKSGLKSLRLKNTDSIAGSNYQRALKFRNLPVEPNTSYRLTFWVKGNNTYTLAGATTTSTSNIRARMSVGTENHDVPFIAAANTAFDYTFTGFDPENWVKKTAVFYYATDDVQKAYYKSLNPDSADLQTQYFLNLNVFNPGTYFIDDVSIVKSTIKGISYNQDVIKVDFGYAINGDALRTGKDNETASLPIESVKVTNNGVELVVEAVEVQSTGFYIFLAADLLDATAEGKLKIDFTNPVDPQAALLYTNDLRPNWESTSKRVADFTNEYASYDGNLLGLSSSIYFPPFLKSATPESESFDLPFTSRTFKLVYSRPIECSSVTATLAGPSLNTTLELAESGYSNTLTFSVKASDVISVSGTYILTVKNIVTDKLTAGENTVLSYEFGVAAAGTIDTLLNSERKWASNTDGQIPHGFKKITAKTAGIEVIEQDLAGGTNRGRTFTAGGQYTRGIYYCYREGVKTDFIYGLYSDQRLHMLPGKYSLTVLANKWQNTVTGITLPVYISGMDSVPIQTFNLTTGTSVSGANVVVTGAYENVNYFTISEENDYLLDFDAPSASGWTGQLIGGINLIKIPSNSFVFNTNLSNKLTSATTTLTSMDSSIYDGVDKTALATVIQKYNGYSNTAPSAYNAAIADVDSFIVNAVAYKAKVDAHFASIVTYNTNLENAKTTLATYTGTKYTVFDAFPRLANIITVYDGLALTDDDSLTVANDTLSFCTNSMTNLVNTCIPALTYRLTKAVALAKSLPIPVPQTYLNAAEACMSDDDAIANALLIKIKQYISHNLAVDTLKFGGIAVDSTALDSLDMTCFMKNPNFYTSKTSAATVSNSTTFPGWTASVATGPNVMTPATAVCPVQDTYALIYMQKVDSFYQTVTGLPKGVYNIDMHTRIAKVGTTGVTQADCDKIGKFFVAHGTDTTWVGFLQADYGLPAAYVSVRNLTLAEGDSFTLGIKATVSTFSGYTPTLIWGDPTIWMVNKVAGVYDAIKQTAVIATVKEVQYYTIQGFRMNAPGRGLNIVRKIYDDGSVKVEKVMIR